MSLSPQIYGTSIVNSYTNTTAILSFFTHWLLQLSPIWVTSQTSPWANSHEKQWNTSLSASAWLSCFFSKAEGNYEFHAQYPFLLIFWSWMSSTTRRFYVFFCVQLLRHWYLNKKKKGNKTNKPIWFNKQKYYSKECQSENLMHILKCVTC